MLFRSEYRINSWKYLSCFVVIFFLTTSTACANNITHNIENNIGLYEVIDKKCNIMAGAFNPCDTIHFLEIVKGQFFGVSNEKISLVFWTGDSRIDPELQYTAQLIKNHKKAKLSGDKIWITRNKTTWEYFVLLNNEISRYILTTMGNSKKIIRHIDYTLKPNLRSNLPHVRLNYPGNQ